MGAGSRENPGIGGAEPVFQAFFWAVNGLSAGLLFSVDIVTHNDYYGY